MSQRVVTAMISNFENMPQKTKLYAAGSVAALILIGAMIGKRQSRGGVGDLGSHMRHFRNVDGVDTFLNRVGESRIVQRAVVGAFRLLFRGGAAATRGFIEILREHSDNKISRRDATRIARSLEEHHRGRE